MDPFRDPNPTRRTPPLHDDGWERRVVDAAGAPFLDVSYSEVDRALAALAETSERGFKVMRR